jgi:hypothetical protein
VNDANLYDIGLVDKIRHVRHALSICERRQAFGLERFSDVPTSSTVSEPNESTLLEAWFLGAHGDLGGSCADDGLSLWPLQWILSEAKSYGLVTGFDEIPSCPILDPLTYIFPTTEPQHCIILRNGINIRMWSLAHSFSMKGFTPALNKTTSRFLFEKERVIFDSEGQLLGASRNSEFSFSLLRSLIFVVLVILETGFIDIAVSKLRAVLSFTPPFFCMTMVMLSLSLR